jgi:2-polyprenyl-6-methoxyphenol hydroxylase-like FAD-dependent oxidoreductase
MMVVATGRGWVNDMFPREPEHCPFERPQRVLCVGLWSGISYPNPVGVTMSNSPGHGELIEIPMLSFVGQTTALLFECVPGGDLEGLAHMKWGTAPKRFERVVLEAIEKHHPTVRPRINEKEFGLARPLDLLQGAITPCVRRSCVSLSTGKLALAIGDVRAVLDPIAGQGANVASYTAWTLGELIAGGTPLGRELCDELERRTRQFVIGAAQWTNMMLGPPPPHVVQLYIAMSQCKPIADEVTDNFNRPYLLRDIFASPEATAELFRKHGYEASPLALP